jgi:hypothetical protein
MVDFVNRFNPDTGRAASTDVPAQAKLDVGKTMQWSQDFQLTNLGNRWYGLVEQDVLGTKHTPDAKHDQMYLFNTDTRLIATAYDSNHDGKFDEITAQWLADSDTKTDWFKWQTTSSPVTVNVPAVISEQAATYHQVQVKDDVPGGTYVPASTNPDTGDTVAEHWLVGGISQPVTYHSESVLNPVANGTFVPANTDPANGPIKPAHWRVETTPTSTHTEVTLGDVHQETFDWTGLMFKKEALDLGSQVADLGTFYNKVAGYMANAGQSDASTSGVLLNQSNYKLIAGATTVDFAVDQYDASHTFTEVFNNQGGFMGISDKATVTRQYDSAIIMYDRGNATGGSFSVDFSVFPITGGTLDGNHISFDAAPTPSPRDNGNSTLANIVATGQDVLVSKVGTEGLFLRSPYSDDNPDVDLGKLMNNRAYKYDNEMAVHQYDNVPTVAQFPLPMADMYVGQPDAGVAHFKTSVEAFAAPATTIWRTPGDAAEGGGLSQAHLAQGQTLATDDSLAVQWMTGTLLKKFDMAKLKPDDDPDDPDSESDGYDPLEIIGNKVNQFAAEQLTGQSLQDLTDATKHKVVPNTPTTTQLAPINMSNREPVIVIDKFKPAG